MKRTPHRRARGFTLLELTIAVVLGMMVAGTSLVLVNNQLAFLRIFNAQSFLSEEAPLISSHVNRLIGKADRFRLHATLAEALSGANPRTTASPVIVLNYRQPDGTLRAAVLAWQNLGSGPALYYYLVPTSGTLGSPQWYITKQPQSVSFWVENGILRMTLNGPNGEQVIYSGTMGQ